MKISMEKPSSSKPQTTTFLDFAFSSAKILFLVVGIASTLFLISTHIQRFILSFSFPVTWNLYPDFSQLSSAYLFIIVHFIIFVIWKLNANHLQDPTQDSSDFYSSPSISRKSSIEDVLVSQPSSESIKEFRTTSQEIPVPEPVVDIHTVESMNRENRTTSREVPDPVLDIHTVESVDVKTPPTPVHDEYSDDMKIYEEDDDYSDSLDATWQAIIQKQLEKADSWEKFNQQVQAKLRLTRDVPVPVIQSKEFRKSETFKENGAEDHTVEKEMRKSKTFRENNGSIGWRGRNVWVEKDETFRSKVEAFIKMNYDQRLKKQGSNDNCRVEMVNTAY